MSSENQTSLSNSYGTISNSSENSRQHSTARTHIEITSYPQCCLETIGCVIVTGILCSPVESAIIAGAIALAKGAAIKTAAEIGGCAAGIACLGLFCSAPMGNPYPGFKSCREVPDEAPRQHIMQR